MLVIRVPAMAGGFSFFIAYLVGIVSGAVNKAVQFNTVLLALNPPSFTVRTLAQRVSSLIHCEYSKSKSHSTWPGFLNPAK